MAFVLVHLVLDNPSLLERLEGNWRVSSGAWISTESSMASRSLAFFAAAAALRLRQPILANETGPVLITKWLSFNQAALLTAKMVVVSPSEKRTPGKLGPLPKTSTWAQLTNFTESHNYFLSSCSINAWEGHWYSAWIGLTSVHERGKNRSEWLGYVVLCAGAAAHGPWRGLNFIVWNFAWDRLASRLYAATATTFLMKMDVIIYPCWE